MRHPKPRRRQTRTKTIIMSGGLNDIVTNLELKEGELHKVKNYMEMDSPYHGYVSVAGYESFDGKTNPSEVASPPIEDSGLDDETIFLIENPTGPVDLTLNTYELIDSGVGSVISPTKFGDSAWEFNTQFFEIGSTSGGAYATAYDVDYDLVTSQTATINLSTDWTIDFQYRPKAHPTVETIFEKKGCYRLNIAINGALVFETSDNGITYTDVITSGDQVLGTTRYYHVSIRARGKTMQMAIDGVPATIAGVPVTATYTDIHSDNSHLFIGRDSDGTQYANMYLDEFRISSVYRWATSFTPPILRYTTEAYWYVAWDDVDREAQRDKITPVPGTGPVLGIHVYRGELYALRNEELPGTGAKLWKANRIPDGSGGYTDASGWDLVDNFTYPDGRLVAVNHRFDGWTTVPDQEVMVMVDGKNQPRILNQTTIIPITDANLPDNWVSPPDNEYASTVQVYSNRVMFGYESNNIFMSSASDPTDFSGGYGAQFQVGDAITNLVPMPKDSLAVICRNNIKVITKLSTAPDSGIAKDFWFRLDDYGEGDIGGYAHTARRILSRMLYADDRGVMDFTDTDKYADFQAAAISKKVNRVYLSKKQLVTTAMTDRELNQYRIFFSDGTSLWFTFVDNELKGATYIEFPIDVNITAQGEDSAGNIMKFFSTTDADNEGFVFQMDSGTSFNGTEIETDMFTSFYHYASPGSWKDFLQITFEITASRGSIFNARSVFDYDDAGFPDTLWWQHQDTGAGGIWGEDNWGTFAWGEGVISRMVNYIRGHGTNMSIEMRTSSKYTEQHVIHNAIVNYQMEDLKR